MVWEAPPAASAALPADLTLPLTGFLDAAGTVRQRVLAPTDLTFRVTSRSRVTSVVEFPAFRDGGVGRVQAVASRNSRVRVEAGEWRVTGTAADWTALLAVGGSLPGPFLGGSMRVERQVGAGGWEVAGLGLVRDAGDRLLVRYDRADHTLRVETLRNGALSHRGTVRPAVALAAPFDLGFVLHGGVVVVLVDTGAGWRRLTSAEVGDLWDLRSGAELRRWRYGVMAAARAPGTVSLSGVTFGLSGQLGLRDVRVSTFEDGTPLMDGDELYLTGTNVAPTGGYAGTMGVYAYHVRTARLRQTGRLLFRRGGRLVGDHAGHLIYDRTRRAFVVLASSWGTDVFPGTRLTLARSGAELRRGVHVLDSRVLNVPLASGAAAWDPYAVRAGGRWHLVYTEADAGGAHLRKTSGPSLEAQGGGFTARAPDTNTEGTSLVRIGGTWYAATAGHDGRMYLYDLEAGTPVAALPLLPGVTHPPHPSLVGVRDGGHTRYLIPTFDSADFPGVANTWGNFTVLEADQRSVGWEHPRRALP